jgi:hypothetical protein
MGPSLFLLSVCFTKLSEPAISFENLVVREITPQVPQQTAAQRVDTRDVGADAAHFSVVAVSARNLEVPFQLVICCCQGAPMIGFHKNLRHVPARSVAVFG